LISIWVSFARTQAGPVPHSGELVAKYTWQCENFALKERDPVFSSLLIDTLKPLFSVTMYGYYDMTDLVAKMTPLSRRSCRYYFEIIKNYKFDQNMVIEYFEVWR
jgi:hypothetical protein